jgi:hypothetical protein
MALELLYYRVRGEVIAAENAANPPGLSIGKAKLQNGTVVLGVIAEPASVVGMKDISSYNGSFRDYIARTGNGIN